MTELFYLAIIWGVVFIASWCAEKTKMTSILYCLAFGAILVNIGMLPVKTTDFLVNFSQLGIIVIMFALGFEENTSDFINSVKKSWSIALFGAIAPFLTCYYLTLFFWHQHDIALIAGLTMTATAVSLTMLTLKNEGLHRTGAARAIIASSVLDDIASLIFLAILIPFVTTGTSISLLEVAYLLAKVLLFFAIVTFLGAYAFPKNIKSSFINHIPILRKYGLGDLLSFQQGEKITLIILFIALTTALLAHWLGFHPAIGAYLAGLVLKEEYFKLDENKDEYNKTKYIIDDIAYSWVGPIFFVILGSHIIFESSLFLSIIPETILLTICIIISQVLSAGLSARYIGKFKLDESLLIGIGMVGRAELAFVVLDIGYVQYEILSQEVFYSLMLTIFFLNISVPIAIKIWKKYSQDPSKC